MCRRRTCMSLRALVLPFTIQISTYSHSSFSNLAGPIWLIRIKTSVLECVLHVGNFYMWYIQNPALRVFPGLGARARALDALPGDVHQGPP